MTKTTKLFPAAAFFVLLNFFVMNQTAPLAQAADADAAIIAADPAAPSALLPEPYSSSLLPGYKSTAELAAEEARDEAKTRAWHKRWMLSLVPLVSSQIMDASSSWGMRELNPALAGADGRFGVKAVGIKFSVIGGLGAAEYFLVKKYPSSAKFFTIVNFSTAGITSGLAWHNYSLPGR
jgi:hypothetical protein